jgi:cytochrome P450
MRRWLKRRADAAGDAAGDAVPSGGPVVFDPNAPDFVRDPYPLFARLRDEEPVHRSPAGPWVLTRYDDVHAALGDERLGNAPARYAVVHARNRDRYVCADVAGNVLPFLDPPAHAGPRRVVGRAFSERLRDAPPDIAGIARGLLARWDGTDTRDVVADYASPLAVGVIADVVGVPREDTPQLEGWSEAFFYLFNAIPSHEVREQLDRALTEFREYMAGLIAERRKRPADDLITGLATGGAGEALSDPQVVDNLMLLFADGLENVDRAIGNATYALLRHPEELWRLRERPELLPGAVDECLRFESPAQYIGRIAREDLAVHEVSIPAGSTVLLALGSANRDPSAFERPDTLDITRSPNPHLAFGRGRHSCIGGPLVELQLAQALRCLLERAAQLELAADRVSFVARPGHRWVAEVPVWWRPT